MRFSLYIFLVLVFITSCKHTQLQTSDSQLLDSLSSETAAVIKKERTEIERQLKDSVDAFIPDELNNLQVDSASLALQGKDILQKEVGIDPELHSVINEIEVDSALLRQAADHGATQAQKFLQEEYGVPASEIPTKIDSTTYQEAKATAQSEAESYLREHSGAELSLDSLSHEQLLDQSEELIQRQLEDSDYFQDLEQTLADQQSLLNEQNALIEAEKIRMEEYMNQKALKEKMTSAAKDFIQEHAEDIQSVQTEMNDMKQVYSKVPDSEDLSSAVKQTSLEEESFGKRLVFGGNFNIGKTDPFSLDLSPLVGYRINTLFTAGITGTYRVQFDRDDLKLQQGDETVYGYSVFASHTLYKNFFGYLEGENKARHIQGEKGTTTAWDQGLLLGIGRQFSFGRGTRMQLMVLYNFLHENDGMYSSPLMIKTGIQFY